ncbi:hypothetical protein [Sporolactobacillus sp. KGMB 08714]|uniref:hypothetical protein n=1 Tax=Sporolactobacillus sp. KGMB 08714 TaxID=3064704 RepID=UPI002FBD629F
MAEQNQAAPAAETKATETKTDDGKRKKVIFKVNVKAGPDKRFKKGQTVMIDSAKADEYKKAGLVE